MTRTKFGERGFMAVGIFHPKSEHNIGSLWRTAALYKAAMLFTVGAKYKKQASDTMDSTSSIPLIHFADIDDLVEHLPNGTPLVGVEMHEKAYKLSDFIWPSKSAILLGSESYGLTSSIIDRCHMLVQIESPLDISMNVACAGSIVLHDRYIKKT